MTWIDRHEKQFCLFCKFCFILYIIWFTMNFGVKSDAGKNKGENGRVVEIRTNLLSHIIVQFSEKLAPL